LQFYKELADGKGKKIGGRREGRWQIEDYHAEACNQNKALTTTTVLSGCMCV